MLNDYLISKDVLNFVLNFLEVNQLKLPTIEQKLWSLKQKQQLTYEQWWSLLDSLCAEVDDTSLGIKIGASVTAEQCGVLGYLLKTSQNMMDALTCYSRFERLLYAGGKVETEQHTPDEVTLYWDPELGYSSLLSDSLLLAGLVNVARGILSPQTINPTAVNFTHPINAANLDDYASHFLCPIQSAQPRLSISFKTSDLLSPIPHEDRVLHSLLGKQAEEIIGQLPEGDIFLNALQDTLIRCLHEGQPDANTVAKHMNISPRTLHRRLKSKHKIYRNVLKNVRKSVAQRYLKDDQLTLSEVALLLGYQDQSAFTRAFSSWFNCSPKQYRSKQIATEK